MVIFHFSKLKNNGLEISKHFVKFYASYVEHEMWLVGRQPKNDDKEMHLFYPKIVNAERIEHFFSSFVYDTETMQPKIAERMHQIIIYSELKFTMKIEQKIVHLNDSESKISVENVCCFQLKHLLSHMTVAFVLLYLMQHTHRFIARHAHLIRCLFHGTSTTKTHTNNAHHLYDLLFIVTAS